MKNIALRGLLLLDSIAFVFFGLKWLISTSSMAAGLGIELTNADALTDAQAVYGGLELGVGFFLALCALLPELLLGGLLAATLALCGLALCRGIGIALSPTDVTGATWQLLGTDIVGSLLNGAALVVAFAGIGRAQRTA